VKDWVNRTALVPHAGDNTGKRSGNSQELKGKIMNSVTRNALLGCSAIVSASLCLPSQANAVPVTVSGDFGPGNAQQFQIGGGDLHSALGAAISLHVEFTYTSDTAGVWAATITNTSGANPFGVTGIVTDFGLSLKDSFGWVDDSKAFVDTVVSCKVDGCDYKDGTGTAGVLGEIDLATGTDGKSGFFIKAALNLAGDAEGKDGLDVGEAITLKWTVTGTGFSGKTLLSDFIDPVGVSVAPGNTAFSAFWVANFDKIGLGTETDAKGKIKTITGDTNIGGAVVTDQQVPEPATLAMFGAGLIGLAAMRRRRRTR
jgi:hypothetical protein